MRMLICSIGSKRSRATARFAASVARAVGAELTLLGIASTEWRAEKLARVLGKLGEELASTELVVDVQVRVGSAESIAIEEMESGTYDIVAVGALAGRRSLKGLLDSVAKRIIERARVSVLIVKGNRKALKRVLICASGTEQGRAIVRAGADLACRADAQSTVLHVVDSMPAMYAGLGQMEETLAELLQSDSEKSRELKWAARAVKVECGVSELKLRRGVVADEILREGLAGDYDIIVVGSSRAAGGLVRVLMGDLTRELVSRAQRPVLVIGPQI
jgi:nucleotide-binding universal stress UspA family protein